MSRLKIVTSYCCEECGERFEEPHFRKTFEGSRWEPQEWEDTCPYCGSLDIEETEHVCDDECRSNGCSDK